MSTFAGKNKEKSLETIKAIHKKAERFCWQDGQKKKADRKDKASCPGGSGKIREMKAYTQMGGSNVGGMEVLEICITIVAREGLTGTAHGKKGGKTEF